MKVLMINVVCGIRSTGRICADIATKMETLGHEVKIAYGREEVPEQFQKYAVRIGTDIDVKLHGVQARLFDRCGWGSRRATQKFINWVKEYDPDIIHLHNLHGYYINIEILFEYLKACGKKIIWTLHDCWPFTGHCTYFDFANCAQWKSGCKHCPQKKEYPATNGISMSTYNLKKKKELFTNIPQMRLVTPSNWLSNIVTQTYMKYYPITVINNGIDTEVFKPTKSHIREEYGIGNTKLILGVAAIWDRRKGLDYLIKLSQDTNYVVAVIGVTDYQIKSLPHNMIGISHTNNVKELIEWYSTADLFVNPTLEDNYPTTNLEAIACGTPVVTFNTGGSPESALIYGYVVKGYKELKDIVVEILENNNHLNKTPKVTSVSEMVDAYIWLYFR